MAKGDWRMNGSNAYMEGVKAFYDFRKRGIITNCPYQEYSEFEKEWQAGWDKAKTIYKIVKDAERGWLKNADKRC